MRIDNTLKPADLLPAIERVFELAAHKVRDIDRTWDPKDGAPVFTVNGKYTTRGWTEWTQGFQFGCPILVFDGTDDRALYDMGRQRTVDHMLPHVTHTGVHDHGFNTISTYGNLRRLMREGRVEHNEWVMRFYETAIKCSGAVQASRWSRITVKGSDLPFGYIYSFNGPQSLFVDTMRTLRVLALAHQLGHALIGENDVRISLLERLLWHANATDGYIVETDYDSGFGAPRQYAVRGRTAHEAIFNVNDGQFRCLSTQQGYSPFSTWTRGLAWAMLGFAEQAEFLQSMRGDTFADGLDPNSFWRRRHRGQTTSMLMCDSVAEQTCEHYIKNVTASDGVPYWDDGAPNLHKIEGWRDRPADPYNDHEPVDASAAAIAAQGLLRLGHHLRKTKRGGKRYIQAGLTVARTLFAEPYLSTKRKHQGLLLHSVYHRPNGWDHVPKGRKVPCDESSMWGDYHLLELAVYIKRLATRGPYLCFFDT